jgi:coenzyme F420-reducing hydrogenase beta subunit
MGEIADMRCGDILAPEEIAEILTVADDVKKWIDEVKEAALADALNGEEIPGFKIVEGRSNRKIEADEATIIGIAEAEGFSEDTIYERKLKGISALESLMGKKRFAEAFKAVIVKPEGKPVLVPESDKREAINIAAKAFEGEMADE